ncbi:MAG: PAS domain S-box protein [Deltaproteobacteria bacterium]|nr:PAS domain S-box protein [Deltaproteobacteria bacterium]
MDLTDDSRVGAISGHYAAIFELATDAIFLMQDRRFVDCNPATLRMFGGTYDAIIGRRPDELSPTRQPDGRRSLKKAAEFLEAVTSQTPQSFDWTHARLDGTLFETSVSLNRIELEGEEYILAIVRDITLRKEAERAGARERFETEARHRQKIETLGTLTASVAHEINNPLMGVINYADLLAERLADRSPEDKELISWARTIVQSGERISEVIKNLLGFARQDDRLPFRPTHLETIVDRTLGLLGAVLRRDQIHLVRDLPKDLPAISCRPAQIQQVLTNLLTNARDALNQVDHDDPKAKSIAFSAHLHDADDMTWIRLTITDQGPGIPKELRHRIFDPFFTTKPADRGTGLGLSVSVGIARDHGGTLSLDPTYTGGSRFHLDLPALG